MKYCINCGKEIGTQRLRCLRCSNKSRRLLFSSNEISQIIKRYAKSETLRSISCSFNCSYSTIHRLLKREMENGEYKKRKRNHIGEKNPMFGKHHSNNTIEKIITGQIKYYKENGYQSTWEGLFIEKILLPHYSDYKITRLHYLKGFNHAYDIAIPELKILIEIDSDYRHGHSGNVQMDKERLARDSQIDIWAKQNSWKIFRFNNKKLKEMGVI